jgi:hypothetical protein
MEIIMSNRTITHEVKLEKSVKIIIGIFAIGVFLNVFSPLLSTKSALAELDSGDGIRVTLSGSVACRAGCN